jgi:predicted Zn finger-like uncharacterized protein
LRREDMVVRCKKCETTFRFDVSLIDGEGAWVRCGRCKNVFFLDKPLADKMTSPLFLQPSEPLRDKREREALPLDREDFKAVPAAEREQDFLIEAIKKDPGESDRDHAAEMKMQDKDEDHEPESEEKSDRPHGKQWVYLIILLLLGGVYLGFFSEIGNQAANFSSSAISTLIEKVLGTNHKGEELGPAQVDLVDIRQRLVVNGSLGIIRVVEGTAVNQSTHPMTRIKVKGEIVGEGNVLLGERESYCGNLLTGDELAAMTEEQFQKELSNPQGSDVSNDRIAPKGQIPFMIIFTREPFGVVKTFVVPAGAERLLP